MTVSPNRRAFYAARRSPPFTPSSFSIDPDSGKLALFATIELCPMVHNVTDRAGRFLYLLNQTDATIGGMPNWIECVDLP
jgi:6-phosphogluconolactonase